MGHDKIWQSNPGEGRSGDRPLARPQITRLQVPLTPANLGRKDVVPKFLPLSFFLSRTPSTIHLAKTFGILCLLLYVSHFFKIMPFSEMPIEAQQTSINQLMNKLISFPPSDPKQDLCLGNHPNTGKWAFRSSDIQASMNSAFC